MNEIHENIVNLNVEYIFGFLSSHLLSIIMTFDSIM